MKVNAPKPIFDTLAAMCDETPAGSTQACAKEYKAIRSFLLMYRGSEATFNAYRRELERLYHWAQLFEKKSLFSLNRDQIERFIQFCKQPPMAWIGAKHVARFIEHQGQRQANPAWRPFVALNRPPERYTLSSKAIRAIFAVLSSFYQYLIEERIVAYNPIAQMRQKSKFLVRSQEDRVIRKLSELQWSYVIETARILANEKPSLHERTLFILSALYGLYLRISELTSTPRWQPQMGHFFRDPDGYWWFKTVGKGNKARMIAVSESMLNALKRYRVSLGLTELPSPGESLPLVMTHRGRGAITSTRQIRKIVQNCFNRTVDRLTQDGFLEDAQQLSAANVHWLRHTGISEDVKHRPLIDVSKDAGHSRIDTTGLYLDDDRRQRAQSAKHKKISPED